ncbi:hypothetical protein P4O66_014091 [Electrophorus voltai]|uniref:Uncharacterized protein n=1 Tax=Electrophorus voltai TaxID=2609070 RepID=A0AAD9DPA4_9TELE|nr:hypothetical protein P4O66_014091 [Electrophorus voltai]
MSIITSDMVVEIATQQGQKSKNVHPTSTNGSKQRQPVTLTGFQWGQSTRLQRHEKGGGINARGRQLWAQSIRGMKSPRCCHAQGFQRHSVWGGGPSRCKEALSLCPIDKGDPLARGGPIQQEGGLQAPGMCNATVRGIVSSMPQVLLARCSLCPMPRHQLANLIYSGAGRLHFRPSSDLIRDALRVWPPAPGYGDFAGDVPWVEKEWLAIIKPGRVKYAVIDGSNWSCLSAVLKKLPRDERTTGFVWLQQEA